MAKEFSHVLVTETWDDVGFSHDISISLCDDPQAELDNLYQEYLKEKGIDVIGLNDLEIEDVLEGNEIIYEEGNYFSGKDEYCYFAHSVIPLQDRITGENVSVVIKK